MANSTNMQYNLPVVFWQPADGPGAGFRSCRPGQRTLAREPGFF